MKLRLYQGAFLLSLAAISPVALSQEDVTLPSGKSQKDEILRAEREANIKDAAHLVELAEGLKADLEKNDRFVLSMGTLKKTDDIEKLVKKIRARLRH
jgi:NAD kinase